MWVDPVINNSFGLWCHSLSFPLPFLMVQWLLLRLGPGKIQKQLQQSHPAPLLTSLSPGAESVCRPSHPSKSLDVHTDWPISGLRLNPKLKPPWPERWNVLIGSAWITDPPPKQQEAISLDRIKRSGRREVVMGGEQATATHFIYVSDMSFSPHLYSFI